MRMADESFHNLGDDGDPDRQSLVMGVFKTEKRGHEFRSWIDWKLSNNFEDLAMATALDAVVRERETPMRTTQESAQGKEWQSASQLANIIPETEACHVLRGPVKY